MKRLTPVLLSLMLLVGCGSSGAAQADPPSQLTPIQKGAPEVPAEELKEPAQSEDIQTPEVAPAKDNEPDSTPTPATTTPKPSPTLEPTTAPVTEPESPKQAPTESVKPEPATEPEQAQQPQSQQIDLTGWVEFHSGDIKTLSRYLSEGKVIFYSGKYYASPKLVEMIENTETVYENDISDGEEVYERGIDPDAEFEIVE